MNIRRNVGCSAILFLGLFELLGYASSQSWNPLDFWSTATAIVKVGLVLLGGLGSVAVLNWLVVGLISENAECGDPQCKNPNIRVFMQVYGGVMRCPRCGRWYHKLCWRRVHLGRTMADIVANGCYQCGGAAEGEPARPLFGREDIFRDLG